MDLNLIIKITGLSKEEIETYQQSKKCVKIVTRHIWEEYKEQANENRYTKLWKDNYPLRKETIERTFGDCL